MNNIGSQITNLITINGKTGTDMTHALKELGAGDMQRGLTNMAEFFLADSAHSLKIGRIQGVIGGAVGVGAIFLVYSLIKDNINNSKHKGEGKAILKILEKNLPEDKAVETSPEEKKEAKIMECKTADSL